MTIDPAGQRMRLADLQCVQLEAIRRLHGSIEEWEVTVVALERKREVHLSSFELVALENSVWALACNHVGATWRSASGIGSWVGADLVRQRACLMLNGAGLNRCWRTTPKCETRIGAISPDMHCSRWARMREGYLIGGCEHSLARSRAEFQLGINRSTMRRI
jgi:hypothetical protein